MAYKEEVLEAALQLLEDNTYEQIANKTGISISTLVRAVRKKRFEVIRYKKNKYLEEEINRKLEEVRAIQEQLDNQEVSRD